MFNHKWMSASLLMGLFAMQSTVSNAEPRIGLAAKARPNAEAIAGGNTQTLSAGSEIYANQTIRTGNRGSADLVFLDSTNLSVGPTSEVRLDKFVYDPRGSAGSVVVQATRGAFRWVTGTQAKNAYQINTPYGTLGVRGTTVEFLVGDKQRPECAPGRGNAESRRAAGCGEECVAKIRLVEGEADYKVAKTGKVARLTQPNQVACITPAGDVTYSTSTASILSFSDASTPAPTFIPGIGGGSNPNPPPVVSGSTPL